METPGQNESKLRSLTSFSRRRILKTGLGLAIAPAVGSKLLPLGSPPPAAAQQSDPDEPDQEQPGQDEPDSDEPEQDEPGQEQPDQDEPDEDEEDAKDDRNDPKPGDTIEHVNGMPLRAYFPETGHHLSGEFLHHWLNNGSFTIYGFPITEELREDGRTVQYFERARLELWPEHEGTEWVIQGTLLGVWKAKRIQSLPALRPLPATEVSDDDRWVFPETRHSLRGGFRTYWQDNGGVHVFGFPISEEFEEGDYNVQYFERARMEWHPENEGTPYIVLLGHLGREYAEVNNVDLDPVDMHNDAVFYDSGVFSASWKDTIRTHSGGWMGYISTDAVGIRQQPVVDAEHYGVLYNRRPVTIFGLVRGEEVDGIDTWYDIGEGRFVSAAYIDPLVAPPPPQTFSGTWVDVNLTYFWAIAYENSTPVYAAIITAGRGDRTPKGVYEIFYRVQNETMDSATVGFPKGHPEYYYLENVLYTQYFLSGGFALHGNYWTPEPNFGAFSSNGCVGLMNPDALFFWNWLYIGSIINIHF